MLFGNCISTEISNMYSQISTIYKCIGYLHRGEKRWLRPLPKCAYRWRRPFAFWHPPRAWRFIALTFWGRAIYPIICFGVAPSMHQISCARFFFSPRSLNSIGFGWVCMSFNGNIAPTPAVFWWIHRRCSHVNSFVGCFQPLLVVAPSIPAFLEFGLVCSCSHRKAPSTLSMFWWIYCRCLHFCNFSFGLAIPFGLLHSLGLGWACICPHGYGTSIPPFFWRVCW